MEMSREVSVIFYLTGFMDVGNSELVIAFLCVI